MHVIKDYNLIEELQHHDVREVVDDVFEKVNKNGEPGLQQFEFRVVANTIS